MQNSKGNLIRKLVDKPDREDPWSPLYHGFKANRSIDVDHQNQKQNIKINNSFTTGVEQNIF